MQLVKYKRAGEEWADELKAGRRGNRDAQRATGTEKAQTKLVAEAALEAADAASETADGKSSVVRSTSPATAAGSYQEGDQWWQFSGANIVGLWLHSGTAWVAQALTNAIIATLDAGKITTGVLAADRIGANSITTAKLSSTAIDGMTVTGAIIRTAASGQRLQLDSDGLKTYNTAGTVTSTLGAWDGQLTLSAPLAADRLQLTPSALWLHDADGIRATLGKSAMQLNSADGVRSSQVALDRLLITRDEPRPTIGNVRHEAAAAVAADSVTIRATLDPDSAGVRQADASMSVFYESGVPRARLSADYLSVAEISALNNVADPGPKNLALKATGATISLTASTIAMSGNVTGLPTATQAEVNAGTNTAKIVTPATLANYAPAKDRPWARIDATTYGPAIGVLGTGFTHDPDPFYDGLHARIKGGVLYITGRLTRASFAGNAVLFTLAAGFRPGRPAVQYAYTGAANFAVARPDGTTIIAIAGTGGATVGFTIPLD